MLSSEMFTRDNVYCSGDGGLCCSFYVFLMDGNKKCSCRLPGDLKKTRRDNVIVAAIKMVNDWLCEAVLLVFSGRLWIIEQFIQNDESYLI